MPLTPAEVHNVAFKKPPIGKRGYDEEEVDAFLDIVEVELSRLIEENNDLRARIANGQPAAAAQAAPADTAAQDRLKADLASVREENGRLQAQVGELERALNGSKSSAQQQVVQLQQQLAQTEQQLAENRRALEQAQRAAAQAQADAEAARKAAPAAQGAQAGDGAPAVVPADHHQQAVQMLALAQQTADQHLAQSKAEAERLLAEAQTQAQTTIEQANASAKAAMDEATQRSSAQLAEADQRAKKLDEESSARARQTISDAEQRAATITAQFEQRKAALERRIEELRTFEREYRSRLKSYLESQLRDLDASGKSEPAGANELAEAQQG
jgi:DivIVA domain-containing protein